MTKLLKSGNVLAVRIKKNRDCTKFKLRCPKYLYTFVTTNEDHIKSLRGAIPKDIHVLEIEKKKLKL